MIFLLEGEVSSHYWVGLFLASSQQASASSQRPACGLTSLLESGRGHQVKLAGIPAVFQLRAGVSDASVTAGTVPPPAPCLCGLSRWPPASVAQASLSSSFYERGGIQELCANLLPVACSFPYPQPTRRCLVIPGSVPILTCFCFSAP